MHETLTPAQDPSLIAANQAIQTAEWQPTHELADQRGMQYPVFTINDTDVIFRNRNEFPQLHVPYHEAGDGALASTVNMTNEAYDGALASSETYQRGSEPAGEGIIEVVPNTPLGLVGAALELGGTDPSLPELHDQLGRKEYSDKALLLLDSIAAATAISDEGHFNDYLDPNGYGLVLAALTGNAASQTTLQYKVDAYHSIRTELAVHALAERRADAETRYADVESLKPEELVLIHSTGYAAELTPEGAAVLYPAGAKREDEYPRSSVHFTVNGEVTSHMNGSWDHNNRLIITNYKKALDANGLPATANEVDTYFDVNPGGQLTLPDATIMESRSDGPLISLADNLLTYAHKESYSADEQHQITRLAEHYNVRPQSHDTPATILREVALRQAMAGQGAKQFIGIGAHYGNNPRFNEGFRKLNLELGVVDSALHANSDEYMMIQAMVGNMSKGILTEFTDNKKIEAMYTYPAVPDAAVRTLIAAGYMPARPIQDSPQHRAEQATSISLAG